MHISGSPHVRENNFDFLRFAAALLVLFSHCYPLTWRHTDEPLLTLTGYASGGDIGVAIFFVMSGFLIASSRLNSKSLAEYASKRAARILPALLLVVCLSVFVLGPVFSSLPATEYFSAPGTWAYFLNVVFAIRFTLPGVFTDLPYAGIINGSLWTLPAEVVMYLGIAVFAWRGRLDKGFIAFVVCAGIAAYFLLSVFLGGEASTIRHVRQLTIFAKLGIFFFAGTLIYLVRERIHWHPGVALLLVAALYASFKTAAGHYILFLALPYLVLYIAHAKLGFLSGFGRFGDFSYGLYIFAFPIQQVVIALSPPDVSIASVFILSTIPTLILATLSWHLVESPALRWNKNRLAREPFRLQPQAT